MKEKLIKNLRIQAAMLGICAAIVMACNVFWGYSNPAMLAAWNAIWGIVIILWLAWIVRRYDWYRKNLIQLTAILTDDGYLDNIERSQVSPIAEEVSRSLLEKIQKKYGDLLATKQLDYNILQSQINPHFLYNTLECIRSQALINGYEEMADMVETLSRYYRYCVSNRKDYVLLEEELENIQNYFKIQQYRFEDRFSLQVCIMDSTVYKAAIPKMTLQPIVENAVFHGLEQKKEGGVVNIKIYRSDADIHIFVADNGCGIPFERVVEINHSMVHNHMELKNNTKSTGIAMINVNRRIMLQYGAEYGVRIYSTQGKGTDVEITMPYRQVKESKELI